MTFPIQDLFKKVESFGRENGIRKYDAKMNHSTGIYHLTFIGKVKAAKTFAVDGLEMTHSTVDFFGRKCEEFLIAAADLDFGN